MSPNGNASISDSFLKLIRGGWEERREPLPHFRMSSLGRCPRFQVLQRAALLPTNPPDDRAVFKMWTGTVLHKSIQRALVRDGFLDPEFTAIDPETGRVREKELSYRSYTGHCDGLTRRLPPGPAIVELKTTDDAAIVSGEITRPMPEHFLWQGFGYCLGAGVGFLLVFQLGRRYGIHREQVFPLTQEWRTKLEGEIGQMEQAWKKYETTQALPPCSHRFVWEDKTCPALAPKESPDPLETRQQRDQDLARFLDEQEDTKHTQFMTRTERQQQEE